MVLVAMTKIISQLKFMGILLSAHLNWSFSQRILHSTSDRIQKNWLFITLSYFSFLLTRQNKATGKICLVLSAEDPSAY